MLENTQNYNETLCGVHIETIVREINHINDYYDRIDIVLKENTTIGNLIAQILSRKDKILEGLIKILHPDLKITHAENISDGEFLNYLVIYLKTRNNISEDEIQELQSSYSSYITSKNKKIFKEKVEKQVTPYNQNIPIGEESLAFIKEKVENPRQSKIILYYLNKYPHCSKKILKLINEVGDLSILCKILKKTHINKFIELLDDNKIKNFVLLINNIDNTGTIISLINDDIIFRTIEILNEEKLYYTEVNKIIHFLNNIVVSYIYILFNNVDNEKIKSFILNTNERKITYINNGDKLGIYTVLILLKKTDINNIKKISELINRVQVKKIKLLVDGLDHFSVFNKICNQIENFSDFIEIINGANIDNLILIINKDLELFIEKNNKYDSLDMIDSINKYRLPGWDQFFIKKYA